MDYQLIPFLLIAMVAIGFIILRYYYSKKAIVKRRLKRATGKRISDFMSGDIAKIVGEVEIVGKPLISPLSQRPCSYYYVLVEQKVSSGKSSYWSTLIEEEIAGSFLVKDGKHYAHVNCNNIKSYLIQDRDYRSGFLEDATDVLEKFLNDRGEKSENFLGFNKTLRYKEGVLEQGELIAVIGRGEWKNSSQTRLPEQYRKVLEISSTEAEPVYLSDDPDTVETLYR